MIFLGKGVTSTLDGRGSLGKLLLLKDHSIIEISFGIIFGRLAVVAQFNEIANKGLADLVYCKCEEEHEE